MKYGLIAIGIVIVAYYAHMMGYRQAVKKHPEYVAARAAERERSEAFRRELAASVSDRELVCDEIIETVQELLNEEHYQDGLARSREPDTR